MFGPDARLLIVAAVLDLAIGDPDYSWHPVRLVGRSLTAVERILRRLGLDGYGGGIVLFLALSAGWLFALMMLVRLSSAIHAVAGLTAHVFVLYSLLALGSLLRHGQAIETAVRQGDLAGARVAVGRLVGRDTDRMDAGALRRAAIESLSENLTDGVISPLFWYVVGGLPALVVFKVVSTMDSMVGYKTPEYLRFGWCGARLDDVMNWIPARLSLAVIAAVAAVLPGGSAWKAVSIGWSQHARVPGPNSGWSEAATAGALRRRLVGPIWNGGRQVTDVWLGDPDDPPLESARDYSRGSLLVALAGVAAAILAAGAIVLPGA